VEGRRAKQRIPRGARRCTTTKAGIVVFALSRIPTNASLVMRFTRRFFTLFLLYACSTYSFVQKCSLTNYIHASSQCPSPLCGDETSRDLPRHSVFQQFAHKRDGPVPFDLSSRIYSDTQEENSVMSGGTTKSIERIQFTGPSSRHVKLRWQGRPRRILFLAKPDLDVYGYCEDALKYMWQKNLDIVLEPHLLAYIEEKKILHGGKEVEGKEKQTSSSLSVYDADDHAVDLIVTFGGDGLLLHCNTLFSGKRDASIPPVMSFDFGSLGFLAPFPYEGAFREANVL
jgi:hypothetical protein